MQFFHAGKDEAANFRFQRACSPFLIKKDKYFNQSSLLFYCLCLTLFLGFYMFNFYAPGYLKSTANHEQADGENILLSAFDQIEVKETNHEQTNSTIQLNKAEGEKCDLFKGRWIPDARGSLYTNSTCRSITYLDCFLLGRKDKDFLYWRWKPDQCELPRFDPKNFFAMVQGKTFAFIGDSLSRNQIESLMCLLSTEETPTKAYKDAEDRFGTWHFPQHNFTVMALWSPFLVAASDIVVNGSATGGFHLHVDKIDERWAQKLPGVHYAIFSAAHWFFRLNYIYEGGKLIGCIYCQEPNVTDFGPRYAIRRAFRSAFKYINNDCKECSGLVTFLRTYSPSHFENGTWNTGGNCNRTSPVTEGDNLFTTDLEIRNIQVEEIENARNRGHKLGNKFDVLDITRAMQLRPDGHPDLNWRNKWMKKDINDCLHWCLPGPVDAWNELLLEMLRRKAHART